jgi:hypothetical protein
VIRSFINSMVFFAIAAGILQQQDPLGGYLMAHYLGLGIITVTCLVMALLNFGLWLKDFLK